jgi:hydrogenase/urease accessory protein HupE
VKRALAALLVLLAASQAQAHEVRPAYLQLTETAPGQFDVLWKQPLLGDRRLPLEPVLPDECVSIGNPVPEVAGAALIERWRTTCDLRAGSVAISGLSQTLTDVLVEIRYLSAEPVSQLLKPSRPSMDLASPTPQLWSYLTFGVEHLLLGLDHILFVVGLVLFIGNTWTLVKTITAFTVAHSITLACSVLGLISLPQGPVEAVIALSILFLARELVEPPERRSRITLGRPWLMAFAFGLLHGFGFAGALTEIGLPADQLAISLLLFNVGIELGQLLVIGLMLGAAAIFRQAWRHNREVWPGRFAWIMGSVAGFWTIDRLLVVI